MKPDIQHKVSKLTKEQKEVFDEIAGKLEYDANLSREEAEDRAIEELWKWFEDLAT
jgi:hypothetical protein